MTINAKNVSLGGLIGKSKGQVVLKNNVSNLTLVSNVNTQKTNVGGLIGEIERSSKSKISQNEANVEIQISGTGKDVFVGGLIGKGSQSSENNFTTGKISTSLTENVSIGGLYGKYENTNLNETIKTSYSTIEIETEATKGALVGSLGGIIDSCFTTQEYDFYGKELFSITKAKNCLKAYSSSLNFDQNVWDLSQELPKLK